MKVSSELYKARIALCAPSPEKRKYILGDDTKAQAEFMNHWNLGKVCGRCVHFSSLGKDQSGICGTCSEVNKTDYTRPEEFCNKFIKRQNIT